MVRCCVSFVWFAIFCYHGGRVTRVRDSSSTDVFRLEGDGACVKRYVVDGLVASHDAAETIEFEPCGDESVSYQVHAVKISLPGPHTSASWQAETYHFGHEAVGSTWFSLPSLVDYLGKASRDNFVSQSVAGWTARVQWMLDAGHGDEVAASHFKESRRAVKAQGDKVDTAFDSSTAQPFHYCVSGYGLLCLLSDLAARGPVHEFLKSGRWPTQRCNAVLCYC
eukprot:3284717-Amphidinium_carterae.3